MAKSPTNPAPAQTEPTAEDRLAQLEQLVAEQGEQLAAERDRADNAKHAITDLREGATDAIEEQRDRADKAEHAIAELRNEASAAFGASPSEQAGVIRWLCHRDTVQFIDEAHQSSKYFRASNVYPMPAWWKPAPTHEHLQPKFERLTPELQARLEREKLEAEMNQPKEEGGFMQTTGGVRGGPATAVEITLGL